MEYITFDGPFPILELEIEEFIYYQDRGWKIHWDELTSDGHSALIWSGTKLSFKWVPDDAPMPPSPPKNSHGAIEMWPFGHTWFVRFAGNTRIGNDILPLWPAFKVWIASSGTIEFNLPRFTRIRGRHNYQPSELKNLARLLDENEKLPYEKRMSWETIGKRLDPPVDHKTVQRWAALVVYHRAEFDDPAKWNLPEEK